MNEQHFTIDIQDALDWELSKETLRQAIVDHVESELKLTKIDCEIEIAVVGNQFVATIKYPA